MTSIKLALLISTTCVLFACSNSKKEYIYSQLKDIEGKILNYPNLDSLTIQGKRTVKFYLNQHKHTIVTYIDSGGCTKCKLHLSEWKRLIHEVTSITNDSMPVLFFLYPKNRNELVSTLRKELFNYPVYIDDNNAFNNLNTLPDNNDFHTFLVNEEQKVIAIGNPIHNPKVKELYLNILSGKEIQTNTEEIQTTTQLSSSMLDMGKFSALKEQSKELLIKNTGNHPLVISEAVTSCGCISVEYNKVPVSPGGSIKLNVIYKAEKPEHFNKTITIYGNMSSSPIVIKVKGEVT